MIPFSGSSFILAVWVPDTKLFNPGKDELMILKYSDTVNSGIGRVSTEAR
jgi:hypothetical protein